MAVNSLSNYIDFYPDQSLRDLGVDGFFWAFPAPVAEDLTGGRFTIHVREGPDAEPVQALRARAYLITQVTARYTAPIAIATAGPAEFSFQGKNRNSQGYALQRSAFALVGTGAGDNSYWVLTEGSSTSKAFREIGWVLPVGRNSDSRTWQIQFEKLNANVGSIVVSVGGYYLDLTPGRHLPGLDELGLV